MPNFCLPAAQNERSAHAHVLSLLHHQLHTKPRTAVEPPFSHQAAVYAMTVERTCCCCASPTAMSVGVGSGERALVAYPTRDVFVIAMSVAVPSSNSFSTGAASPTLVGPINSHAQHIPPTIAPSTSSSSVPSMPVPSPPPPHSTSCHDDDHDGVFSTLRRRGRWKRKASNGIEMLSGGGGER